VSPDLPASLDAVLDPGWLTASLRGLDPGEEVVQVSLTETIVKAFPLVRFEAVIEGPHGRRTSSYCAKGQFSGARSAMETEVRYYRDLAEEVGVRVPGVAFVDIDDGTGDAVVVQEDIVVGGGRCLDARDEYSLDMVRETLGELARLHAATWGAADLLAVPWLAPRLEPMVDLYDVERLQELLDDGRAADLVPELRDATRLGAALRRVAELPTTCMIHGDTHSGNVFVDRAGRVGWFDWQLGQRGSWSVDVAYHLGTVLPVETRRAHEADLLRHYLDRLAAGGAPAPDFEQAWDLYVRSAPWGYFLWAITTITSRAIVEIHVPRLGAALTDHDTFRLLGV
jgi:hypothetical protein